eukprot:NODE_185_length_1967_cov_297.974457_g161_i0.p1 GENE.NODE_185_length_1967_cov_297.974457_g161_i0~~NODE_185_length_1967_cov_297.974457_g161_i0.p1  ORF type:complete len:607 (-),score=200.40 NODE_185_length_1967_cov_297.974457_g161_i0:89-1909(-)
MAYYGGGSIPAYGGVPLPASVIAPPMAAPAPILAAPPVMAAAPPPVAVAPPIELNPGGIAEYEEEEEMYRDWWQYSRFALPWLLFILVLLLAVFWLTFHQQAGWIKDWWDGVPRIFQRSSIRDSDYQGGMHKAVRNLRIAACVIGFVGVIGAFLVYFARPKRGIRLGVSFLCALLVFVAGILAFVAMAEGLDHFKNAQQCSEAHRFTFAKCRDRSGIAIAALWLDGGLGLVAIIAAVLLAYNAKQGHWRMAPRDWVEEQTDREQELVKERAPGEMIHKNVSFVRKMLTGLFLFFTLVLVIFLFVFMLVLHEDREIEYLRNSRGRSHMDMDPHSIMPFEHGGWPVVNTRLRYATVALGIVTVLLNFLPFRSRTVAVLFAFGYFCTFALLLICFGFDVDKMREIGKLDCPRTVDGFEMECIKSPFIALCCIEFLAALCLLVYLIVEYLVFKGTPSRKPLPSERYYGVFGFSKVEVPVTPTKQVAQVAASKVEAVAPVSTPVSELIPCNMCGENFDAETLAAHVDKCSCRPLPCDACGDSFRARDYEHHRSVCGDLLVACPSCDSELQRFRLQMHQEAECPKRMVLCKYCGDAFRAYKLDRHQAECQCH